MADSASREMGISDARANMTEVISEVRLLGRPVVLTRREKPQAVLVSVDFYEQAVADHRVLNAVYEALGDVPLEERDHQLLMDITRRIMEGPRKPES
ncbi:type II toxin-antitoxin system Phd/YefM family antitoxin [Streptomyces sp. NPDC002668]|uniref:type II toxin-antitoxin system Phd/YefM family antitoxin n=1 Tax=Streptomyces sp. NPDC002668 TaxID=3154422 RepID=UPI003325B6A5